MAPLSLSAVVFGTESPTTDIDFFSFFFCKFFALFRYPPLSLLSFSLKLCPLVFWYSRTRNLPFLQVRYLQCVYIHFPTPLTHTLHNWKFKRTSGNRELYIGVCGRFSVVTHFCLPLVYQISVTLSLDYLTDTPVCDGAVQLTNKYFSLLVWCLVCIVVCWLQFVTFTCSVTLLTHSL